MNNEISVRLAPDLSEAIVRIPAGLPREMVTGAALLTILREVGLRVDAEVERTVQEIADTYAGVDTSAVLARSRPPRHGEDGAIEWRENFDPAHPCERAPDADAAADYYAGRRYVRVESGDVVGAVRPPTEGVDGQNVRGEVIKAKPGRKVPTRIASGLELRPDGTIVAVEAGVLLLGRDTLEVSQLLEIRGDVDFSSGHVEFSGSVRIDGGVKPGFRVRAQGDIYVDHLIEVAEITCGGSLLARCGMAGKGKGRIDIGGSVEATYLEEVRGCVQGDLRVRRGVVGCELKVGGALDCPSGVVMGGTIAVGGSIKVKAVGSGASTPTRLELGDAPVLRLSHRESLKALREFEGKLAALEEQERTIRSNPAPTPGQRERLTELSFEIDEVRSEMEKLTETVSSLDAKLSNSGTLDFRVEQVIHAGVVLDIGDKRARFDESVKGPISIYWDAQRRPVFRLGSAGSLAPLESIAKVGAIPGEERNPGQGQEADAEPRRSAA